MFFKVMLTVATLGFVTLIALQNRSAVDIRLFMIDLSVPVAVIICCFLFLGFGIGLIWRGLNKEQTSEIKKQVPIIADLRVCK